MDDRRAAVDHAAVFDPLAADQDRLNGLHANTQIPKWVGAAREYKATGTTRYRDIALNAWNMCVAAHTYAIGGNSQGEHFRAPNAIAAYLTDDTCESCNTYNMLKLTRELFLLYPDRAALFDYYEQALLNQLIGQQNPGDSHGHVCYFTPLRPGGRRIYSNDYNAFTCCQGTGLETQTKLMDSIYFFNGTTLTVNLFAPSVLTWSQRGITVTQTTSYPASDTTTLQVTGNVSGSWSMRIRVPGWTSGATISVNGVQQNVDTTPGTYAALTCSWTSGDTVTVRLPMRVIMKAANDNPNVSAITYGPVVLSGNYGSTSPSALPALNTGSITRTSGTALTFTATANSATVNLIPFYDAHGHNYTVYWNAGGQGGGGTSGHRLVNAASGLVLGIQDMSTADGGLALQWGDSGTADHDWEMIVDGAAVRFRNVNSGKVLGVENMSVADGGLVIQWGDSGTADHLWTAVVDSGGYLRLRNSNSGKALGVENAGTAAGARVLQWADNGTADHRWRLRYGATGYFRIQCANDGRVLGVSGGSTAQGAQIVLADDTGANDRLWRFV
ncbi:beta-L-arabinofuranosidase domain-containing protein [Streptosporangium amethystogenes]|uniref:beta-L-arabinofuranosidase domain-containing protein n=1 Tax=Streptosporangium amethystogenes TaxID=2002 RepID=UPI003795F83E